MPPSDVGSLVDKLRPEFDEAIEKGVRVAA
jgi:hypothetical protein